MHDSPNADNYNTKGDINHHCRVASSALHWVRVVESAFAWPVIELLQYKQNIFYFPTIYCRQCPHLLNFPLNSLAAALTIISYILQSAPPTIAGLSSQTFGCNHHRLPQHCKIYDFHLPF